MANRKHLTLLKMGLRPGIRGEQSRESYGPDFSRATLVAARLSGAHLDHANFHGANLEKAALESTNLRQASLSGAILTKATLSSPLNGWSTKL